MMKAQKKFWNEVDDCEADKCTKLWMGQSDSYPILWSEISRLNPQHVKDRPPPPLSKVEII